MGPDQSTPESSPVRRKKVCLSAVKRFMFTSQRMWGHGSDGPADRHGDGPGRSSAAPTPTLRVTDDAGPPTPSDTPSAVDQRTETPAWSHTNTFYLKETPSRLKVSVDQPDCLEQRVASSNRQAPAQMSPKWWRGNKQSAFAGFWHCSSFSSSWKVSDIKDKPESCILRRTKTETGRTGSNWRSVTTSRCSQRLIW